MYPKKIIITLTIFATLVWASFHLYRFTVADIHGSIGQMRLAAGDLQAAETHLKRSLRIAPANADCQYGYGEFLYDQAKKADSAEAALALLQQAKTAYQKATELNPLEGNPWLGLAQTRWWLSRFKGHEKESDLVESSFLRALSTDPNNGKFLYAVINYYLSSGEPTRSLNYVKRLAMVYPQAYWHLKKHSGWSGPLQDHFSQGLLAAAGNALVADQALGLLASITAQENNWVQAAAYTEKIIENSGSRISSGPFIRLGHYYLELKDQKNARASFLQALKISDEPYRLLQNLLWDCNRLAALDLYLELCRETARSDVTVRSNLPFILGQAHFYNNDLDTATEYLRQSLAFKETAEARRYLAEIAFKKEDWDGAELESQRATVLDPHNAHYHRLFVRSLKAQKKYRSALEAITQAIHEVRPPRHDFYNIQGNLNWRLGDYRAAIQAWQAAKVLAPENAHYPHQIGRAYRMLEDYSSAERYYLAALKLKPEDVRLKRELEAIRKPPGTGKNL